MYSMCILSYYSSTALSASLHADPHPWLRGVCVCVCVAKLKRKVRAACVLDRPYCYSSY